MEWIALLTAGGLLAITSIFLAVYASRVVKAGPNEALIISGRQHAYRTPKGGIGYRGFKIVKGGRCFVWPIFEKADRLSLEIFEVGPPEGAKVLVRIGGDAESIARAAEMFLSKSREETVRIVREIAVANGGDRERLRQELAKRGLEIVSAR